jgi:hypothetical protein
MINSFGKKASVACAARHCLHFRSYAFKQLDLSQDFHTELLLHCGMFYVKLELSQAR